MKSVGEEVANIDKKLVRHQLGFGRFPGTRKEYFTQWGRLEKMLLALF